MPTLISDRPDQPLAAPRPEAMRRPGWVGRLLIANLTVLALTSLWWPHGRTIVVAQWRATVEEMTGRQAPQQMTEGRSTEYREWGLGYDPSSWLDRCIQETREASFPLLGIDLSV